MNKKFAVFDMDGTLVDSMGYWNRLSVEFLRRKGVSSVPADVLEAIKPMTMSESAALFVQVFSLEDTPERIEEEMNHMMDEHYHRDIPLKEGIREYLEDLHQKGVAMCVASATAEPLMEACLSRLGVRSYFEFLLSCETVGAGKPSRIFISSQQGGWGVPLMKPRYMRMPFMRQKPRRKPDFMWWACMTRAPEAIGKTLSVLQTKCFASEMPAAVMLSSPF